MEPSKKRNSTTTKVQQDIEHFKEQYLHSLGLHSSRTSLSPSSSSLSPTTSLNFFRRDSLSSVGTRRDSQSSVSSQEDPLSSPPVSARSSREDGFSLVSARRDSLSKLSARRTGFSKSRMDAFDSENSPQSTSGANASTASSIEASDRERLKEAYIKSLGLPERPPRPKGLPCLKKRVDKFELLMSKAAPSHSSPNYQIPKPNVVGQQHTCHQTKPCVLSAVKSQHANSKVSSDIPPAVPLKGQTDKVDARIDRSKSLDQGDSTKITTEHSETESRTCLDPDSLYSAREKDVNKHDAPMTCAQHIPNVVTGFQRSTSAPETIMPTNDSELTVPSSLSPLLPVASSNTNNNSNCRTEILHPPGRSERARSLGSRLEIFEQTPMMAPQEWDWQRNRLPGFKVDPAVIHKVYTEEEKAFILESFRKSGGRQQRTKSLGSCTDVQVPGGVTFKPPRRSRVPGKLAQSMPKIVSRFENIGHRGAQGNAWSRQTEIRAVKGEGVMKQEVGGRSQSDSNMEDSVSLHVKQVSGELDDEGEKRREHLETVFVGRNENVSESHTQEKQIDSTCCETHVVDQESGPLPCSDSSTKNKVDQENSASDFTDVIHSSEMGNLIANVRGENRTLETSAENPDDHINSEENASVDVDKKVVLSDQGRVSTGEIESGFCSDYVQSRSLSPNVESCDLNQQTAENESLALELQMDKSIVQSEEGLSTVNSPDNKYGFPEEGNTSSFNSGRSELTSVKCPFSGPEPGMLQGATDFMNMVEGDTTDEQLASIIVRDEIRDESTQNNFSETAVDQVEKSSCCLSASDQEADQAGSITHNLNSALGNSSVNSRLSFVPIQANAGTSPCVRDESLESQSNDGAGGHVETAVESERVPFRALNAQETRENENILPELENKLPHDNINTIPSSTCSQPTGALPILSNAEDEEITEAIAKGLWPQGNDEDVSVNSNSPGDERLPNDRHTNLQNVCDDVYVDERVLEDKQSDNVALHEAGEDRCSETEKLDGEATGNHGERDNDNRFSECDVSDTKQQSKIQKSGQLQLKATAVVTEDSNVEKSSITETLTSLSLQQEDLNEEKELENKVADGAEVLTDNGCALCEERDHYTDSVSETLNQQPTPSKQMVPETYTDRAEEHYLLSSKATLSAKGSILEAACHFTRGLKTDTPIIQCNEMEPQGKSLHVFPSDDAVLGGDSEANTSRPGDTVLETGNKNSSRVAAGSDDVADVGVAKVPDKDNKIRDQNIAAVHSSPCGALETEDLLVSQDSKEEITGDVCGSTEDFPESVQEVETSTPSNFSDTPDRKILSGVSEALLDVDTSNPSKFDDCGVSEALVDIDTSNPSKCIDTPDRNILAGVSEALLETDEDNPSGMKDALISRGPCETEPLEISCDNETDVLDSSYNTDTHTHTSLVDDNTEEIAPEANAVKSPERDESKNECESSEVDLYAESLVDTVLRETKTNMHSEVTQGTSLSLRPGTPGNESTVSSLEVKEPETEQAAKKCKPLSDTAEEISVASCPAFVSGDKIPSASKLIDVAEQDGTCEGHVADVQSSQKERGPDICDGVIEKEKNEDIFVPSHVCLNEHRTGEIKNDSGEETVVRGIPDSSRNCTVALDRGKEEMSEASAPNSETPETLPQPESSAFCVRTSYSDISGSMDSFYSGVSDTPESFQSAEDGEGSLDKSRDMDTKDNGCPPARNEGSVLTAVDEFGDDEAFGCEYDANLSDSKTNRKEVGDSASLSDTEDTSSKIYAPDGTVVCAPLDGKPEISAGDEDGWEALDSYEECSGESDASSCITQQDINDLSLVAKLRSESLEIDEFDACVDSQEGAQDVTGAVEDEREVHLLPAVEDVANSTVKAEGSGEKLVTGEVWDVSGDVKTEDDSTFGQAELTTDDKGKNKEEEGLKQVIKPVVTNDDLEERQKDEKEGFSSGGRELYDEGNGDFNIGHERNDMEERDVPQATEHFEVDQDIMSDSSLEQESHDLSKCVVDFSGMAISSDDENGDNAFHTLGSGDWLCEGEKDSQIVRTAFERGEADGTSATESSYDGNNYDIVTAGRPAREGIVVWGNCTGQITIRVTDENEQEMLPYDPESLDTFLESIRKSKLQEGQGSLEEFGESHVVSGEDDESSESMDKDSLDDDSDGSSGSNAGTLKDILSQMGRPKTTSATSKSLTTSRTVTATITTSDQPTSPPVFPHYLEAQNESPPLCSLSYMPLENSELTDTSDNTSGSRGRLDQSHASSVDHPMTLGQGHPQEQAQGTAGGPQGAKSKLKEKRWKEAEDAGTSSTVINASVTSPRKLSTPIHLDLASVEMDEVTEADVQELMESPGSGLHRIPSAGTFQQGQSDAGRLKDPYRMLERSQSDASLLKRDLEMLATDDEVHLTAAEASSGQNISECNRVYLDLSRAEAFERVELGETSGAMMRTSSGRLLETIPQDEELKTGDLSYVYATHRSFSQESSSSVEDLTYSSKGKGKDGKFKSSGCKTSQDTNSITSSKSNLKSSFQIYSHSLKQKVRQLQMGSLPEQVNALTELNVLMEQAWSMPVYGKDLAYELCDILRTESALDIIVSNLASSNRELMKVSARLLEQSLTTTNRRQVAENGLELVVKMTHDCRGDCELAQTCTGILESLFKTSEETCAKVIKLGGLDTITYWCRCNDRVTLKNCAIALSNLALYGGGENQQEMAKHKVPEWLFPLAFVEDDSVRYYALLAIGVMVSNKEIENAVMSSGTLALVLPFIDSHDPAEFAQRDMSHRHGRSPGWLKRLIPVLSSKREEAQALAAFHFVMEAGIKSEQGRKEVLYKIGAVDPLKHLASTPNRVASKLAAQALKIIGEEIPHKLTQQVPLWACDDVVHWIAQVGFGDYTTKFQASQVDGDLLLRLTEEELRDSLGMTCAITRKRFLRELRDLKISSDYTSCDPSMLGAWLRDVGEDMSQYTYQMLITGVDRPLLRSVTDNHLTQDCKIQNGIHRMKILTKIEELRSTLTSPSCTRFDSMDGMSSAPNLHKPPIDVFISYRRSNGSQLASLLKVHLQLRGFTVFIDIEKLRAGKFDESLLESVRQAKNFIIVLTPNSLDRCMGDDEKKDWVHREISAALDAGINIIPLLDSFKWPSPDSLPEDMKNICYFNAVRWIHDYQDACVDKLERFLRGETNPKQPHPSSNTSSQASGNTAVSPKQNSADFESPNSPPYQRAQGMRKISSVDSPGDS